jgi:hypothetical protein
MFFICSQYTAESTAPSLFSANNVGAGSLVGDSVLSAAIVNAEIS